jgi:hypothetical protein
MTLGGLAATAPQDATRTAFGQVSQYLLVPVGLGMAWAAKQVRAVAGGPGAVYTPLWRRPPSGARRRRRQGVGARVGGRQPCNVGVAQHFAPIQPRRHPFASIINAAARGGKVTAPVAHPTFLNPRPAAAFFDHLPRLRPQITDSGLHETKWFLPRMTAALVVVYFLLVKLLYR